jgi:SAM-dependent methyltransferase
MGDTTTVSDSEEEFAGDNDASADLDALLWVPIATAALGRSHPEFDQRVLDAFCGEGASALPTAELVGHGGLVDAVDPTESRVEVAREHAGERMPQLHLHAADVTTWEPDDYDLVQCVLGLDRLPDVEAETRRLIERARPGGSVAITVWARGALAPLPELLAGALHGGAASDIDAASDTASDSDDTAPPVDLADTPGTLAQWLTQLGLVDVRAETVQRHLDLTPELAWQLVPGTSMRAIIAGLDDDELDAVRERYLGAIADRAVTSVDVTTLIAVGRRPAE